MKFSQEGYLEYESQGVIIRLWPCGKYQWNINDIGWQSSDEGIMPILGIEVSVKDLYQFLSDQYRKQ